MVKDWADDLASDLVFPSASNVAGLLRSVVAERDARITVLEAERDAERAKVAKLRDSLEHMQWCRWCAENSWDQCGEGRRALDILKETA